MKFHKLSIKSFIIFNLLIFSFVFNISVFAFVKAPTNNDIDIKSNELTDIEKLWIKENSPFKIGVTKDWPPFEYIDIQGDASGINVDLIESMAQKIGMTIEFVPDTWQNNLSLFKSSDIDLLMGIRESQQRHLIGDYSQSYMQGLESFFTNESLTKQTFTNLTKQRVALPKEFSTIDHIIDNYPQMTIIEVDTLHDAVMALNEGRVELIYDNYHAITNILRQQRITSLVPLKMMSSSGKTKLHFLTQKDEPIFLTIINKMINTLAADDVERISRIHLGISYSVNVHDTFLNNIMLTDQEKAYLAANPVITFTGDPNWLPYEGVNEHGDYVGIVPEFLDVFEQRLGIKIQRDIGQTWQDSVQKYINEDVNVISEISDSLLDDTTQYSDVYLSSPIVMLMRNTQNYVDNVQSISHLQLSIIKDYGYVKSIKEAYPTQNFNEFTTITEGLKAVATGETDVLFLTLAQASYQIAIMGTSNVRIVGSTELTTELAFGVHEKDKLLIPIFNKVLNSISNTEKQAIIDRWGKNKFVARVDYVLVFKILIAAVFIILLIILWYQRLLREINARQEAQAHYKTLLDLLPTQVMIISAHGIVESVNRKVLEDYNIDRSVLIGQPFTSLLDAPCLFQNFMNMNMNNGRIDSLTLAFSWPQETRTMMLSMESIMFEQQSAYLTLAVDISERVDMENAIIDAKNAAIEANKAKSSFLANMSHEIRTPMNAIIGFTELLFDQIKEPQLISYVKTIRSAGSSLLLLINDILDLSKIEANKVYIKCNETNLHRIIEEVGLIFEVEIKNKNLDFIVEVNDNVPNVVMLDESRLRQILFNLVGNAVKFTDQGCIQLHINANTKSITHSDITFSIIDTGIGIDDKEQKLIFESFMQPKEQSIEDYGGTGLGLTISKGLIELMKGELTVDSMLGKGSTFSFTLPDVETLSGSPVVISNCNDNQIINFNNVSVLVADDVEYNRQLLVELLPQYGIKVDIATNGLEAIEKIKEHEYSLVFIDIRMPKMNGYDAAKIIKQLQPQLPIVAFTASIMFNENEITQRNGFDGLLKKPVLKKDILKELKKHLPFSREQKSNNIPAGPVIVFSIDSRQHALLRDGYLTKCNQLTQRNNIDEISEFIVLILQFAIDEDIVTLIDFCRDWATAVDNFDVVEIQRYGQRFIEIIE